MKKNYVLFSITAALVICIATAGYISAGKKSTTISREGFAVVELFTSEGCSSCPAADETVARLLKKDIENVYILAFHVDYWNRLGWKDPFSKAEYSQRQNQYASRFKLGSVYTSQVIVNGSAEFVSSDENKLSRSVENSLHKQVGQPLIINAKKNDHSVSISYDIEVNEDVLLNIPLVQPEATIFVKKGENGGRTLHHINIVKTLKVINTKGKGSVIMMDNELNSIPLQIIAYTQAKETLQILGADQKTIK